MIMDALWFGDPGIDDTLAVVAALRSGKIRLRAACGSSGNSPSSVTSRNFSLIFKKMGINCPVYRGMYHKVSSRGENIEIHGKNGLGNVDLYGGSVSIDGGLQQLHDFLMTLDRFTIIETGPMTDLSFLMRKYGRDFTDRIEGIVAMGGSICSGNVTPSAEFNIIADPKAASVVVESGIPLKMITLDTTQRVKLYPKDIAWMKYSGLPMSNELYRMLLYYFEFHKNYEGFNGCYCHDPMTVVSILDPGAIRFRSAPLKIDITHGINRGRTVFDLRHRSELVESGIQVSTDVDEKMAKNALLTYLRGAGKYEDVED